MNRSAVIERLKDIEPLLRARGIAALYLFGSYARDEAGPGSDIDIFVDPVDEPEFGLGAFSETYDLLEKQFPGIELGFSTRDSIAPSYLPSIERAAIRVF